MTQKYLSTPCPRCGEKKLPIPVIKPGRIYTKCDSCRKKSLYLIHEKNNGELSYTIIPIGKPSRDMVRATFWIFKRQKRKLAKLPPRQQSDMVRSGIDKILDI